MYTGIEQVLCLQCELQYIAFCFKNVTDLFIFVWVGNVMLRIYLVNTMNTIFYLSFQSTSVLVRKLSEKHFSLT